MLFQTLTVSEAAHQLLNDDNASWSYEGAHALADYLGELWEDCGAPERGFDVVAVRCDYSEMTSADLVTAHGYMHYGELPADAAWAANCEEVMEELKELVMDNTHCFIELDNGNFVVGSF